MEPGERAFRAGVALTNALYDSACALADAFELACTPPYIGKALAGMFPGGWTGVAEELVKGLVTQVEWVVAGAGIGAMFGLGLGLLLPPAEPLTLAGGAALGAAIAQWALVAVGLVSLGSMTIQIGQASIELFGSGVREALAGNKESAARMFAVAMALVIGGTVPLAIICALTRGAGKMVQSQSARFMINRLTSKIAATRIATAAQARMVGLMEEEWRAIAQSTMGIFKVFRGCNPSRVGAIQREGGLGNVHFKPGYLKDFKSAKVGRTGEYSIERGEFQQYIAGHYELKPMGGGKFKVLARDGRHAPGTYLDNTSPVKGGPWLDEHIVEEIVEGGQTRYVVRHPDDKTFVPDIDRLLYAEIGRTGRLGRSGVLRGHKWLENDDPREVMHWNTLISRAISKMTGKELDWRGFQHGKSADYLTPHQVTGEVGPGWPSRNAAGIYQIENENIVIAVNGNLFITDWNGLGVFCKSLEMLGFKYPWARSVIL